MTLLNSLLKTRVVREVGAIVFVDVGAAVGVEPPWDELVGSGIGKIVGFEPHPDNLRQSGDTRGANTIRWR